MDHNNESRHRIYKPRVTCDEFSTARCRHFRPAAADQRSTMNSPLSSSASSTPPTLSVFVYPSSASALHGSVPLHLCRRSHLVRPSHLAPPSGTGSCETPVNTMLATTGFGGGGVFVGSCFGGPVVAPSTDGSTFYAPPVRIIVKGLGWGRAGVGGGEAGAGGRGGANARRNGFLLNDSISERLTFATSSFSESSSSSTSCLSIFLLPSVSICS